MAQTELNANASTAGALFSSSMFEVPPYQREYAWQDEEVKEFYSDIQGALEGESYFLGLVILTEQGQRKQIVDGQQRIVTLSLLAAALFHEATRSGRKALADRLQADFLSSIDYATDETKPRVWLTDSEDNVTFQDIIANGTKAKKVKNQDSTSGQMRASFDFIAKSLATDLAPDPFRRLGKWTEFITHKLYFAVFVHPNPATAYGVFEVINTRGRDLTTADLLKNFILSQTPEIKRESIYENWKRIASTFSAEGTTSLVQYIRHVITVESGYVLPRDLFAFLANRDPSNSKRAPSALEVLNLLGQRLPIYSQMIDPTLEGPAEPFALKAFIALNKLNVITVRPLMLAISDLPNPQQGLEYVLKLVVRRIIVGTLGTGNIERRFSDAAKKVKDTSSWGFLESDLRDLNPTKDFFESQLSKRSFNKGTLSFIRNSIVSRSIVPETYGVLHFVMPKTAIAWPGFDDDERAYWLTTIGNTFLSSEVRRPGDAITWPGFKVHVLPTAWHGEWVRELEEIEVWDATAVKLMAARLAKAAADIWYA
ncbi:DUF262 domain-containing protein [Aestuariivirga litoralis]|uniref:DUF262 domain-containing protein n=1 Tax=Aestuariivirga litoralis TaxID=2650924 RepID=UPI0018C571E7|nr:DUF262 domain-containing protein [Aestuariivirga litoralis]MBG1230930.1 DUF262 domain-containing protein [Aestuariivirga litoralis]